MNIFIDFETYSECNLKTEGVYKYASHPSTEILMMAHATEDGPVELWVPGDVLPGWLFFDDVLIHAHNANFERVLWDNVGEPKYDFTPVKLDRWRDTAALCAQLSLPRSLKQAADVLQLKHRKLSEGTALINTFSKPRKPTKYDDSSRNTSYTHPGKWDTFCGYCVQDVEVEREIYNKLHHLINSREQKVWELDAQINDAGIYIDVELINACLWGIGVHSGTLKDECRSLCGLSPSQVGAFLDYINLYFDPYTDQLSDLTAESVEKALENPDLEDGARRLLEIRQSLSQSSTSKFKAMKNTRMSDHRIRGTLLYHGASTGRWSGKMIQPQNFPRPKLKNVDEIIEIVQAGKPFPADVDPMTAFSTCLRGAISAPDSHSLAVVDFSAIEAIITCYMADQADILQEYRDGKDAYVEMAKVIYETDDIDEAKRALGKTCVLGLGFGMGCETFFENCEKNKLNLDRDSTDHAHAAWRMRYPKVVKAWNDTENVVRAALARKDCLFRGNKIKAQLKDGFLLIRLPSGRRIAFPECRVEDYITLKGVVRKNSITFLGQIENRVQWKRKMTWGSKCFQNIVQAVARDVLSDGMLLAAKAGYKIVSTVHDEILIEMPERDVTRYALEDLQNLLCQPPHWAPDLFVGSDGYIAKRYRK